MLGNIIRMALGQPIEADAKLRRFSGVQFVTPFNQDRAERHFAALQGDARVVRTRYHNEARQQGFKSSLDRLGYIIAVAESLPLLNEVLDF